jgi:lysine 2,3-aminomutase
MQEELTNPAGTVTRRYPDRLIINVTSECASYCRFCQRRRHIGCRFGMGSKKEIEESIEYVRDNKEIRDVLVTGGDPLTLKDSELEWILSSLRAIPHVEIIRIGTRIPVTMPMRITEELCAMLKKYHPLYINTHFNHPMEVCEGSKKAAENLADAGIPLGNQMVLLNGINNDKDIVKCLNQELLKIRIKPYYIFHPKAVKGTNHFKCSIDEGIEIMEHLRGYTSGLAIPYYIVNAPGGLGKVPILPQYLISRGKNYFVIRTWEGKIVKCEN